MPQLQLFLAVAALSLLTGCASITRGASLDSIPVCEIAPAGAARAYVSSMFGWLGPSFRLTDASAVVLCNQPTKESAK